MRTNNCYVDPEIAIRCKEKGRTKEPSSIYKNYPRHPSIKYSEGPIAIINGKPFTITIIREWDPNKKLYRTYTDDLKYGNKLEIIYSKDKQMFIIKDIDKLKEQWNLNHGIPNNPLDIFIDMEFDDGMQDL